MSWPTMDQRGQLWSQKWGGSQIEPTRFTEESNFNANLTALGAARHPRRARGGGQQSKFLTTSISVFRAHVKNPPHVLTCPMNSGGGVWRAPREPQNGPSWGKTRRRWPQDGPRDRTTQTGPKIVARGPKMTQVGPTKAPQMAPR